MKDNIFYFLCYPSGDKSKITVIDEYELTRYEKDRFALVNDLEWDNSKDAIDYGRKLAEKYDLIYEPFESRCRNENEYLYL